MTDTARLEWLTARALGVLLDFDGPVCSIFAGYSAPAIADELRSFLRLRALRITSPLAETNDPLYVLRLTGELADEELTRAAADVLRDAEVRATESAVPTPGGHEALLAAAKSGRRVAVVSNNSQEAVRAYLMRHGLLNLVDAIVGRYDGMPPAYMKPHAHLVSRALTKIGIAAQDALLVGDSVSDIEAAQIMQVPSIGYANEPWKIEALQAARANLVVTSMNDLAFYFSNRT